MNSRTTFHGLLLGLLMLALSSLRATELLPVEHFFKNPERSELNLSPDGKYLAALAPFNDRMNIFVIELGTNNGNWVTGFKDADVTGIRWINDERILFRFGRAAEGTNPELAAGLFSVRHDGRDLKVLVEPEFGRRYTQFFSRIPGSDDEMLVISNERLSDFPDIYRMRVRREGKKMEVRNPGNVRQWIPDHQGRVRLAITGSTTGFEPVSVLYREDEKAEWRSLGSSDPRSAPWTPLGFDVDNKHLLVLEYLNNPCGELRRLDPTTGKFGDVLFAAEGVEITGVIFSNAGDKLLGVYYDDTTHRVHWFDERYRNIQREVDLLFPDKVNILGPGNIASNDILGAGSYRSMGYADDAESKLIVRSWSSQDPGTFYLFLPEQMAITKIAQPYPWINPSDMGRMFAVSYPGRDGLNIPAFLSLPAGLTPETAKDLPLIVNPHGGPWARDVYGYDAETQFLVNRGFAVLKVNFRGSEGYGRAFLDAGRDQIGLAMQHDLTDGVKWAIAEGIADPKRVGIFGASYGGYATMAGLTFTPELYQWGINYVGVADVIRQIEWYNKIGREFAYEFWVDFFGDPSVEADRERLYSVSPINFVERIKVPLFIIHGKQDFNVDIEQSMLLMRELDRAGVTYTSDLRKDEGHGYRKEENRIELYQQIDDFLLPFRSPGVGK